MLVMGFVFKVQRVKSWSLYHVGGECSTLVWKCVLLSFIVTFTWSVPTSVPTRVKSVCVCVCVYMSVSSFVCVCVWATYLVYFPPLPTPVPGNTRPCHHPALPTPVPATTQPGERGRPSRPCHGRGPGDLCAWHIVTQPSSPFTKFTKKKRKNSTFPSSDYLHFLILYIGLLTQLQGHGQT